MSTTSNSYADIFFDKYRELERLILQKFPDAERNSPVFYLVHKPGYEKYAVQLECCREIRNLISHYPKEKGAFPIEPSVEMVRFLEELIYRMSNRPKCRDVGVSFKNMYWRTMKDSVTEAMAAMREGSFTHVPILEGRKLIGMFDPVSLFNYLADSSSVDLENLTFADIRDYLSLEGRRMEIFTFHHQFMFLDELQEVFQKQYRKGRRISAAFLTNTGSRDENIIAMLTSWDVLGKDLQQPV